EQAERRVEGSVRAWATRGEMPTKFHSERVLSGRLARCWEDLESEMRAVSVSISIAPAVTSMRVSTAPNSNWISIRRTSSETSWTSVTTNSLNAGILARTVYTPSRSCASVYAPAALEVAL